MTRRAIVSLGLACFMALGVQGCSEKPTQIIIAVDTNLIIPAELNQMVMRVDQRGTSGPIFEQTYPLVPFDSTAPGGLKLPATITLVAGDTAATVEITVTGMLGHQRVVERRAHLPFVKERALLLNVDLLASCTNLAQACPPEETCTAMGCESIAIDPATLPNYTEELALARMDAAVDTRVIKEASVEAGLDMGPRDGGPDFHDGSRTDALGDALLSDADGSDGPASDAIALDGPRPETSTMDGPFIDGSLIDGPRSEGLPDAATPQIDEECLDTFAVGTVCGGGTKYTTKLGNTIADPWVQPGGWVVMPGGCANQLNEPTCAGTDSLTKTRAQAAAYCQSLVLHGFSNWQLPAYHHESISAVNYEKDLEQVYDLRAQIPGLAISTDQSAHYWTTSQVTGSGGTQYWSARFWQPKPQDQGVSFNVESLATSTRFFRCIREYQP